MIIIAERGQFGNQLWQFNYSLAKREGSEKIFLIGFDELSRIIKKEKNIFFISRNNFFSKILLLFPGFVSKILFKTRLFKCIYEDNLNNIKENYPIFKNIKFILGFFQRENLLYKDIKNKLIQNSRYESKAVNLIKKKRLVNQKVFFVHIRLKDGITNPIKEYPAVLPLSWYIKCQKIIKRKFSKCKFIYLSDDPKFLKKNFKKKIIITNKNLYYSFFIMKNCDGGILSPSTYSWWAAYLSNKRGFFLAPKYWIGHRQKVLFPSYFTSKIITYKKVLPSEYNKSIKNEKLFYPLFKYKK